MSTTFWHNDTVTRHFSEPVMTCASFLGFSPLKIPTEMVYYHLLSEGTKVWTACTEFKAKLHVSHQLTSDNVFLSPQPREVYSKKGRVSSYHSQCLNQGKFWVLLPPACIWWSYPIQTGEMAHQAKVLATKSVVSDDVCLSPRCHKMGRENWPRVVLCPPQAYSGMCAATCTHKINESQCIQKITIKLLESTDNKSH